MRAFEPSGPTVTVSATTTSAVVSATAAWREAQQVLVSVAPGGDLVHVAWAVNTRQPTPGSLTATTADVPIFGGVQMVLSKGAADLFAIRANAGTATVYLTPGTGL
jgi:hypothetical protein